MNNVDAGFVCISGLGLGAFIFGLWVLGGLLDFVVFMVFCLWVIWRFLGLRCVLFWV